MCSICSCKERVHLPSPEEGKTSSKSAGWVLGRGYLLWGIQARTPQRVDFMTWKPTWPSEASPCLITMRKRRRWYYMILDEAQHIKQLGRTKTEKPGGSWLMWLVVVQPSIGYRFSVKLMWIWLYWIRSEKGICSRVLDRMVICDFGSIELKSFKGLFLKSPFWKMKSSASPASSW